MDAAVLRHRADAAGLAYDAFKRGQENEFDVAITYRMMPKFPINTGVIFFHSARMPQGADFMAEVLRTFVEKDYPKRFLGDQYVMNDIIQGLGTKVTIKDKVYEQKATNANGTEILVVHIDVRVIEVALGVTAILIP